MLCLLLLDRRCHFPTAKPDTPKAGVGGVDAVIAGVSKLSLLFLRCVSQPLLLRLDLSSLTVNKTVVPCEAFRTHS